MSNGPDTSEFLTAGGPNEVTLKPHYPDGKKKDSPDWWEGTGTYTVSNKSDEVLNVLVQATLAPSTTGGAAAAPLSLPADAIAVDKARVTLHPNQNEQAKVALKVPPQPDGQTAVLSVVFKDELRPNNIAVTYDSTVKLEAGKPGGSKLWLVLLLIAAVLVVGGGVAAFLILKDGDGGGTIPVPEGLAGKTQAEATAALAAACADPQPCLTAETDSEQSSEVGHGLVISTDPEPGEKLDPGDSVTLLMSRGQPVTLTPVEGNNMTNALTELQALCQPTSPVPCLSIKVLRAASDTITVNNAIKTEPGAGATVEPESAVTLFVSNTLKGSLKIPAQATADIDVGEIAPSAINADLYYDVNGSELESGYPDDWGARFLPPVTPQAQGFDKCTSLDPEKFQNVIPLAGLTGGDHVCMRTSAGNDAELEILSLSGTELRVAYTVWVTQRRCPFKLCQAIDIGGVKVGTKIIDLTGGG